MVSSAASWVWPLLAAAAAEVLGMSSFDMQFEALRSSWATPAALVLSNLPEPRLVIHNRHQLVLVDLLREEVRLMAAEHIVEVQEHQPVGLTGLAVLAGEHIHTLDARLRAVKLVVVESRISEELREDIVELLLLDEIHHARDADTWNLRGGGDRSTSLSDIGVRRHVSKVEYWGTERFCYLLAEKVVYKKLARWSFNFFLQPP